MPFLYEYERLYLTTLIEAQFLDHIILFLSHVNLSD